MERALGRKDTTKGPPLRILSLDGGGVRGYSMLIIIQDLMHKIYHETHGQAPRRDRIPKPCDHFDLICGTGTGGLIAIMLGRLRLDLETCKEVYVRMTRKVFETDKTIAGIPYRSTLFKASKLEEAIKECVREHTIYETEGNDAINDPEASNAASLNVASGDLPARHASNASVVSFSNRHPSSYARPSAMSSQWGDANALLYDGRENRTKTAVTACYKGTPKNAPPAILRSYDSRKEPAPETDCTIWQAGRATSATGLAFKPIQIGQSVFIDEGSGQFNPSPYVLDEACVNEWPGREVGIFISIGTGKRPAHSDHNQHLWYEDFMSDFAEARRKLINKIEGCETTHQYMRKDHLGKRGVNPDNYYRLNVEIGVGEFGMNEWNRLAEISTSTRRYIARPEVQKMMVEASAKAAKIVLAKQRIERSDKSQKNQALDNVYEREPYPLAVELPAEVPVAVQTAKVPENRSSFDTTSETLAVRDHRNYVPSWPVDEVGSTDRTLAVSDFPIYHTFTDDNKFVVPESSDTARQRAIQEANEKIAIMDDPSQSDISSNIASRQFTRTQSHEIPPPLPPKTPFEAFQMATEKGLRPRPQSKKPQPPYPVDDMPPIANMARKPRLDGR